MGATRMFGGIYHDTSTLVTGHTGFKGSWLRLWLEQLGARVSGYALAPPSDPSHSDLLALDSPTTQGDIRDLPALLAHMQAHAPEIVFHLAAQASVLVSYEDPLETLSTNVLGTATVLEACRRTPSVRAAVIITTDKCYENMEWERGYVETDALGGHDPYSASKACAELVSASYRNSFSHARPPGAAPLLIATARGGNVVGGGDWTADRLIPDIARAAARGETVRVRNPESSRPWQHVLEPLAGYLLLGKALLEDRAEFAEAWNFGPPIESNLTVAALVGALQKVWPAVHAEIAPREGAPHEARLLMLDSSKAHEQLQWEPVWEIETALARTADWYRAWYDRTELLSAQQLDAYTTDAANRSAVWAR